MQTLTLLTLGVHILTGSLAVIVGFLPIFAPKRFGFHTRWGRRFARLMIAVIGSAAVLTLIALKPYFAALTAAAAIGCFSGVRVLRRKRPDLVRGDRARPLDWIFTLAVLAVALALMSGAVGGEKGQNATVFYALIGGAAAYSIYDLYRFALPTAWPFFPRLWFYEHLVKMLGAYSATVAAFSGSMLQFLPIPEPWKQLWATILFHNLMIVMIVWYALQARRRKKAIDA